MFFILARSESEGATKTSVCSPPEPPAPPRTQAHHCLPCSLLQDNTGPPGLTASTRCRGCEAHCSRPLSMEQWCWRQVGAGDRYGRDTGTGWRQVRAGDRYGLETGTGWREVRAGVRCGRWAGVSSFRVGGFVKQLEKEVQIRSSEES